MTRSYGVILVLLFVICPIAPAVNAQNAQLLRSEQELSPWKAEAPLGSSEKRCGQYFIVNPNHTDGVTIGPGINWTTLVTVGGKPASVSGLFMKSKLKTVIDDKKRLPTVQYVMGGDNSIQQIVVRISRADFERAKECLPNP